LLVAAGASMIVLAIALSVWLTVMGKRWKAEIDAQMKETY